MHGAQSLAGIMLIHPDLQRFMATYDDQTLDCIAPVLLPGEKEHVLVFQDETIFHTNEYHRQSWLMKDQQLI